jgi:hypothetical protein
MSTGRSQKSPRRCPSRASKTVRPMSSMNRVTKYVGSSWFVSVRISPKANPCMAKRETPWSALKEIAAMHTQSDVRSCSRVLMTCGTSTYTMPR